MRRHTTHKHFCFQIQELRLLVKNYEFKWIFQIRIDVAFNFILIIRV